VWLQEARSYLRCPDPVLARLIDERPDFDPGQLREAGLSWRKIDILRDLAERLSDDRQDQDVLRTLPDDELMAEKWQPFRSLATSYLSSAAFEQTGAPPAARHR